MNYQRICHWGGGINGLTALLSQLRITIKTAKRCRQDGHIQERALIDFLAVKN